MHCCCIFVDFASFGDERTTEKGHGEKEMIFINQVISGGEKTIRKRKVQERHRMLRGYMRRDGGQRRENTKYGMIHVHVHGETILMSHLVTVTVMYRKFL